MTDLSHFTQLTSLLILAQDITEIKGLECCLQLKMLWICETKITEIKNLNRLSKLTHLYL